MGVTGKNENPTPTPNSNFTGNVDENSPIGTKVVKVLCEDPDVLDTNGTGIVDGKIKSYTLLDNANGAFKLDNKSGEITVAGDLDFETKSSYTLQGQCGDAGNPSL